jgi:hypothetical protein
MVAGWLVSGGIFSANAGLVLNELMTSNAGALLDEDGDSSDWIELWNSGAAPIDLKGFGLSDRSEDPFRWVFDSYLLDANQHLVVFASGKDRQVVSNESAVSGPEGLDGLTLWLVAEDISAESQNLTEDGGVLRWSNRIQNSIVLSVGNPSRAPRLISSELNGSAVVHFDKDSDALETHEIQSGALAKSSEMTMFLVQRTHAPRHTGSTLFFQSDSGRRINFHGLWSDGVLYFDFGHVEKRGRLAAAPPSGFLDEWRLVTVVREPGDLGKVFVNGTLLSEGTMRALLDENENGNLALGAFNYQGDIAEIILVNRGLENESRQRIESYLAAKYQLRVGGGVFHSNFKLKSAGETVTLSDSSGKVIDQLSPGALKSKQSFGRALNEGMTPQYFDQPTPGLANLERGFGDSLDPPELSHQSGFYEEAFRLFMRHTDPSVSLRYTLDGSDPTLDSLAGDSSLEIGSTLVSQSDLSGIPANPSTHRNSLSELTMPEERREDFGWLMPTNQPGRAITLNVRAFAEGRLPSAMMSRTFFVGEAIDDSIRVPIVSMIVDPLEWFDVDGGLYVAGDAYDPDAWRHQFWGTGNYFLKGRFSERVAKVDVFDGERERIASGQLGLRIHGGGSRAQPQKSLRLVARKTLGSGSVEFAGLLGGEGRKHRQLILRNSGQDSVWSPTLLRDRVIQTCAPESVIPQSIRPVVVYLNGEYWGIHQLQERFNEEDLRDRFSLENQTIDLIEVNGKPRSGDAEAFFELRELADSLDSDAVGEILERIDARNFIDHYITQIYFANTDWPGNNIAYWRARQSTVPGAPDWSGDGRWRWLTFGTEAGLGLGGDVTHNSIERLLDVALADGAAAPWSTALFRRLITHTPFRFHFLARFASLMNREFGSANVLEVIGEKQDEIAALIPAHVDRWKRPLSEASWIEEVEKVKSFAMRRPMIQRQHLLDAFEFDGLAAIDFDVQPSLAGEVVLKGLTQGGDAIKWRAESGVYFGGIPLLLEAIGEPGYRFTRWNGDRTGDSPSLFLVPSDGMRLVAEFERIPSFRDLRVFVEEGMVRLELVVDRFQSADDVMIETSRDLIHWGDLVPENLEVEEGVDGEGLVKASLSVDRDFVGGVFFRVILANE